MAVFSTFRLLAAGIAAAAALTSHVLPARELLTPAVAAYDELAPDLTEPEDTTLSEGAVTIPVPLPEEGSVTISQAAPNTPPAAHTPAVAPVTPAQAAASVKIPSGPLVTDSLFTDAYRAYRKGNLDELLRLQPQLTGHPLASYVDLWVLLLNAQANPKDQETVRQLDRFISTRQNDYVAERARADWARIAAKNDDARLFYRLYKKLEWNREEPDLVCSKARFDLKTGDRKKTAALAAPVRRSGTRRLRLTPPVCAFGTTIWRCAPKMPGLSFWSFYSKNAFSPRVTSLPATAGSFLPPAAHCLPF